LPLLLIAILLAFRSRRTALIAMALTLLLAQRVAEDGAIYPTVSTAAFYPRTPVLRAIPSGDQNIFRITARNFAFIPDSAALYELEDSRGYDAFTFRRLYETYWVWAIPQAVSFNQVADLTKPFLSFLNIRYAIVSRDNEPPPGWKTIAEDAGSKLFENTRVLPRALVPRRIRYERSPVRVMAGMYDATDFADVGWIETPDQPPHEIVNGPGRLNIRRDGFGFDIDARMEGDGWVVVSQPAWQGWRAYIDGRRVRTQFANHAFVGVFVPRGAHRVKITYLPDSFVRGRAISFATLAVLLAFGIFRGVRGRLEKPRAVGL
jgi:hypothetical protein